MNLNNYKYNEMTTNYIMSRFVMTPKKGYKKSDTGILY